MKTEHVEKTGKWFCRVSYLVIVRYSLSGLQERYCVYGSTNESQNDACFRCRRCDDIGKMDAMVKEIML